MYEEATKLASDSADKHAANQSLLRAHVEKVCGDASLDRYRGASHEAARLIWHELWTKNRFAGIQTRIAERELRDIWPVFDRLEDFTSAEWDIEIERRGTTWEFTRAGTHVLDFANRRGLFEGKRTVDNRPKLKTLVHVARRFNAFLANKSKSTPSLEFVTGGAPVEDVWAIHNRLVNTLQYRADLTALHFMMDIGFPVMKPDVVVSHLFQCWGWLDRILPVRLGAEQVARQHMQARVYKPIIDLSREIAATVKPADLEKDIGWVTHNPLREFDLFMAKFGQEPDSGLGIVRKLHRHGDGPDLASVCSKSLPRRAGNTPDVRNAHPRCGDHGPDRIRYWTEYRLCSAW